MRKIQLLVVDDSPFVCRLVSAYFRAEPDIEVAGQAHSGRQAIEKVKELHPDVITMDLQMPDMDGLAAVERIMQECPTPIIALSGVSGGAAKQTLRALELGAVDFVLKFSPGVRIAPEQLRRDIITKVRSAAHTRVIRLRRRTELPQPPPRMALPAAATSERQMGLVVIGASTGGPVAVRDLVINLPENYPHCILIVQHMPAGFTSVLASQLDTRCALSVSEAREGEALRAGQVLVSPGGNHITITARLTIALLPANDPSVHCPSIDMAMESAAKALGARVKGVVLTGMGDDGSKGLAAIRARGGETFAQDAESCVISSMPQKAIDRGLVDHVATPQQIASLLAGIEAAARR